MCASETELFTQNILSSLLIVIENVSGFFLSVSEFEYSMDLEVHERIEYQTCDGNKSLFNK